MSDDNNNINNTNSNSNNYNYNYNNSDDDTYYILAGSRLNHWSYHVVTENKQSQT